MTWSEAIEDMTIEIVDRDPANELDRMVMTPICATFAHIVHSESSPSKPIARCADLTDTTFAVFT